MLHTILCKIVIIKGCDESKSFYDAGDLEGYDIRKLTMKRVMISDKIIMQMKKLQLRTLCMISQTIGD